MGTITVGDLLGSFMLSPLHYFSRKKSGLFTLTTSPVYDSKKNSLIAKSQAAGVVSKIALKFNVVNNETELTKERLSVDPIFLKSINTHHPPRNSIFKKPKYLLSIRLISYYL